MEVTIEGKGTFSLALENGSLIVSKDNQIVFKTKGNPRKRGNPDFTDIAEAESWWRTTPQARPIVSGESMTEESSEVI